MSTSLAGRILSSREASKKLVFYDVHGQGAKVQVVADKREITDQGEVSNPRYLMKSVFVCVRVFWKRLTFLALLLSGLLSLLLSGLLFLLLSGCCLDFSSYCVGFCKGFCKG